MILLDANLILYAHIEDFPQHPKSKAWLEKIIAGGERVALAWQVITAFVRIGTNAKLFKTPMTIAQAEKALTVLLENQNVNIISPTEKHWEIFQKLLKKTNAAGNLVMDAHLAALAVEHQARLASTDADFKLFSGVDYFNPLIEE